MGLTIGTTIVLISGHACTVAKMAIIAPGVGSGRDKPSLASITTVIDLAAMFRASSNAAGRLTVGATEGALIIGLVIGAGRPLALATIPKFSPWTRRIKVANV